MPRPPRPTEGPTALPAPVSISAVAASAGVSIATVSRVINGVANKASTETVERVRAAIEALGYRPLGAGRSLRHGRSRLVAVLAANLANPSMAAIAASAEAALRRAGYVMVLCDTHDSADLQDEYLLEMRAQYACGFVLLGAVASPVLAKLADSAEPLVFVNRHNPHGAGRFVGIDSRAAGVAVARRFATHRVHMPALIHASLASSATADRVAGFREQLAADGITLPASRVRTSPSSDHLKIGFDAMRALLRLSRRPDAVFCTSDLIAYGAHRACVEAGCRMHITGFDDSPLNPWIAPWLDTVRVPYPRYGDAIVRALRGGPQYEVLLDFALVERSTMPTGKEDPARQPGPREGQSGPIHSPHGKPRRT